MTSFKPKRKKDIFSHSQSPDHSTSALDAQASHVEIVCDLDTLSFEVRDNGVGISIASMDLLGQRYGDPSFSLESPSVSPESLFPSSFDRSL